MHYHPYVRQHRPASAAISVFFHGDSSSFVSVHGTVGVMWDKTASETVWMWPAFIFQMVRRLWSKRYRRGYICRTQRYPLRAGSNNKRDFFLNAWCGFCYYFGVCIILDFWRGDGQWRINTLKMNFDCTAFISCVIECVKSISYVAVTYKGLVRKNMFHI